MKRAYFQYYETFENVLEKIKDLEEREHMRKTIINYGLYGTLPAGLSELEEMAWTICKDLIDQQQHRREVNAANRAGKKAEPATTEENSETKKPVQEIQPEKPKRNAMKSWQAAVQNWNTRNKANNKAAGTMWENNSTDADTAGYEDLF